jgi:hypothetical protein
MNTSDEYVWFFARNRLEALEWKDKVDFYGIEALERRWVEEDREREAERRGPAEALPEPPAE